MSKRHHRLLKFWLVIALQAMTPFIHAHAGTVPSNHTGLMHTPPIGLGSNAALMDVNEAAFGMPLRQPEVATADGMSRPVTTIAQPVAARMGVPGVHSQTPPSGYPLPPDHALPQGLAPTLS